MDCPFRTKHLADLKTPTLICQGTRDPFGTREEVSGYELSERVEVTGGEDRSSRCCNDLGDLQFFD